MTKSDFRRHRVWLFPWVNSKHVFLHQIILKACSCDSMKLCGPYWGSFLSHILRQESIINNTKLWPLCCFSPISLSRSLGLPHSPSRTPCRVWKPPRGQLHRAAECAGSPRARPHTTRRHTRRQPARSEPWGTSTCVTATSKSFCHPANTYIKGMNRQNINIHIHGWMESCLRSHLNFLN